MAGNSMFNQVYFDNVRIPAENRVGEENRGWQVTTTTLDFERSGIGWAINQKHALTDLLRFIQDHRHDGRTTLESNPGLRFEIADRWAEAFVARGLAYRVISMQAQGRLPNYESSMVKLFGTELSGRVARTWLAALGMYGEIISSRSKYAPLRARIAKRYLFSTTLTIAGGTSEVQRNIIATRGLGLPKG
jgi:alkylation response protein AidB-like acyl-CoA dehydrogenase